MSMKVGSSGKTAKIGITLLSVLSLSLLLSACPPPVNQAIAIAVTDNMAPTVNVDSPAEGSVYSGTIVFTGTVTDDAITAGDGKGTLASISYSVANNELLKGKIKIDSNGNATRDAGGGTGTISWDNSSHTFSFGLNTTTLTSSIVVYLTASDAKGNATTKSVSLSESNGPLVTFNPNMSNKYDKSSVFVLSGTICNSKDDKDSVSKITTLSWQVTTMGWSGKLDLTGSAATVSAPNSGFSVIRTYNFVFTRSTHAFSTQFYIDSAATALRILPVQMMATDVNGHIGWRSWASQGPLRTGSSGFLRC
jgi:hypothetical protein